MTMFRSFSVGAVMGSLLACGSTGAQAQAAAAAPAFNRLDAIPGCYGYLGLKPSTASPPRAFYLLIDQTTQFDASLKQTVLTAARRSLQPGTEFAIGTFSAFLGDRYTDIALAGRTDAPLPQDQRDDTGKTKLRNLDQCMTKQLDYARRLADAAVTKAFGEASAGIAKSDVFASLHDFASHVIQPGASTTKVLLIGSDMLENSSISSFYAKRAVRQLDAAAELKRIREKGLIPDLTGVRVYVLGAGLLNLQGATAIKDTYRDPQTMLALENFWKQYFKAARAELIEFGKPQLLRPVE